MKKLVLIAWWCVLCSFGGAGATQAEILANLPDDSVLIHAKEIAAAPSCVMAPGRKKIYVSCNGFMASALSKGMTNYIAELTPSGKQALYVWVHAHDPMTQLMTVGNGDSWSSGVRPGAPDYYIDNNGETAGDTWAVSNAGGSVSVGGYEVAHQPLSDLYPSIQAFLSNIKSQLSGGLHGKLVQGGACRVAGVAGDYFAIIDTMPNGGPFVHSIYCIGSGGGPLLSSVVYMAPKRLGWTWEVTQIGGVPAQSPPRPLTRLPRRP